MRTILIPFLAIFLILSGSAIAQQEPINCQDSGLGLSAIAVCEFVDRIDDRTILRQFSVKDGSSETYSKKEFTEALLGGLFVERRIEAEDGGGGYVHLSFASRAICSTPDDKVTECIGSIPQRNNGASCRKEYVSSEDGFGSVLALLICPVVTGWGTGFVEGGEIYLISANPIAYVGYFPTFAQANDPVTNIDFDLKSKDRLGPSDGDHSAILDRCIEIRSGATVMTRCEKYEIRPNGSVASLQGVSSFNTELSEAYRSLIDVRP